MLTFDVLNFLLGNLIKAHLHYIRDLGLSIRAWARTQWKQVNWCFVFTLIWVLVQDFCLGHLCPSSLLRVAISLDTDVRVRPRLCNAQVESHWFTWSLLQATKNCHCLGWPSLRCSVTPILSVARTLTRTRILGQNKCKCALMHLYFLSSFNSEMTPGISNPSIWPSWAPHINRN